MLRIIGWDILGGTKFKVIGDFDSIQITGEDVRDGDGNVILHYFAEDHVWFDMQTGNGWYDWTVEAI